MPGSALPAGLGPHRCVVLGIDPGATSGWALLYPHEGTLRLRAGTCARASLTVVEGALGIAADIEIPLVVVAEKWTAGGWASHTTLLGLGAAWGAWLSVLEQAGIPKRRIVRVFSQTWRARVIGGPQRPTDAWKAAAQRVARARYQQELEPDAAEAACIATWGIRARQVEAVLPKPRKTAPRKEVSRAAR